MIHSCRLFLFLAFLLAPPSLRAATHVLFEYGEQTTSYTEQVQGLRPGDRIVFSNGKSVQLGKRLGSGNTTWVFALAEDPTRVIRIPKKRGRMVINGLESEYRYSDFIDSFVRGEKKLAATGIPVVQVHESLSGEYVIVERVTPDLTFRRFLTDPKISPRLRKEMTEQFLELARKSARFEKIGDFHPEQLFYDGRQKQWRLLDWHTGHREVLIDQEKWIRRAPNVFYEPLRTGAEQNPFFHEFAQITKSPEGQAHWIAREPRFEWIAKLANDSSSVILNERLTALAKWKSGRIKPPSRPPRECLDTFRSFLSGGR